MIPPYKMSAAGENFAVSGAAKWISLTKIAPQANIFTV